MRVDVGCENAHLFHELGRFVRDPLSRSMDMGL